MSTNGVRPGQPSSTRTGTTESGASAQRADSRLAGTQSGSSANPSARSSRARTPHLRRSLLRHFWSTSGYPAVSGTLRPLSLTQYRSVIKLRIVPKLGKVRLQSLSSGHLNAAYRDLEQEGLSASTRRLTHAVVSRSMRDAVRWGRIPRNPAASAVVRRALRRRARQRGRRRNSAGSSRTSRTIACTRSGGLPRRQVCVAASL